METIGKIDEKQFCWVRFFDLTNFDDGRGSIEGVCYNKAEELCYVSQGWRYDRQKPLGENEFGIQEFDEAHTEPLIQKISIAQSVALMRKFATVEIYLEDYTFDVEAFAKWLEQVEAVLKPLNPDV